MPSIELQGVHFAHSDSVPLLTAVDLTLRPGWTGVVGANGAGKTTLLRLLLGEHEPDAGRVVRHPAGLRVSACNQRVESLEPAIETFARSSDGLSRRLRGRLELCDGELERWPSLSPGERKRWQVGAALADEPGALLLDEPTNHLDSAARSLLLAALFDYRGIGVVVSHDRTVLDEIVTTTIRFAHGTVSSYRGGYETARCTWEAEERERRSDYEKIKREQRKLKNRLTERRSQRDYAEARTRTSKRMKGPRDNATAGGLKQTRRRSAVTALGREIRVVDARIQRLDRRAADFEFDKEIGRSLFVDFRPAPRATLFALEAGSVAVGGEALFSHPALRVDRDARIRLGGVNGSGKTTLLGRLLASARIPDDRRLVLPQEIDAEAGSKLLDDAQQLDHETRGRLMQIVAALGVDPEALLASHSASPGEARKLALASGLARQVWALVLDEPTNHLDLPSIERLESALDGYPGALVLVTHDERFGGRLTNTRWEIRDGAVAMV